MKTRRFFSFFVATIIAAASHVATGAEQALSFLGSMAPAQAVPDKVIVISDKTRYVNVTSGETVQFIVGRRSFTWSFEPGGAHIQPFDLRRIAPPGFLNHAVSTYVADDPLYQG